ncbi:MAG: hypothetical protein WC488_03540 [Candidatus Micrarchaeia archaeon]
MKNILFVLLFAGLLLPAAYGTDYTVVSIGGNLSYDEDAAYVVLDDIESGSHSAIITVLDSGGEVLAKHKVSEKKHVIVQIGRDLFIKVSVNQTAPGFAENAMWAQLAVEDAPDSTPTPTSGYVIQMGGVIYEDYGVLASSGIDAPVQAYAILDDIEQGTMNAIVSVYNSDDELLYRDNIKQGKYVKHTVGNATYAVRIYQTAAGYTHNSAWARMSMEQTSSRPDSYEGTAVSVGDYMLSGDGNMAVYVEDVEEGTRQAMLSIYFSGILGDGVNNGALYYEKIKEGRNVIRTVNDITYKIKVYKTASGYNLSGKWVRFSITRLSAGPAERAQMDSTLTPGKLLRAGSGPERIDDVYPFYFDFADLETGTRNAMLYIYDLDDNLLYSDEIKERGYVVRTINGSNYKIGITQTAAGYSGNMAWFKYTLSRTNRRATPYEGEVLVPRGLINDSSQTIAVGMYDLEDGSRNAMLAIMPYEGPGSIDQSGVDAPRAYYYENMRENSQAVREVDGQNFRVKIYQTSLGYLGLATWAKVGIASTHTGETPYVDGTVFAGDYASSDDFQVFAVLDDIELDSHEAILSIYGGDVPSSDALGPQQEPELLFQTKARAGQNVIFDYGGYTYTLAVLATAQGYNDNEAWAKMEITGGGPVPENA